MRKKILVVDDEEDVRRLLRRKFERCGYEVAVAASGKEAIRKLGEEAFDVVITDVLMPEGDGLEVLVYLRREQPGVGTIAISAGDQIHLDNARGLGAAFVFAKPFKLEALEAAVRELIDG